MNRRKFIRSTSQAGAFLPFLGLDNDWFHESHIEHLVILHTNDVHSRIDPFPMDGGRNEGRGGAARRAAIVKKVRKEFDNVLLFDSGDIFQGTPYFNMFKGELEIKLMSKIGYDAGTIGNHDFDAGIDGFHRQLKHANFPFVISNYEMSDTVMNGNYKAYHTFQKGDIKVGIYGLGIELEGLVPKTLYKNTQYQDPISTAQKYENILRSDMNCDLVICLSHLGFKYRDGKVSDVTLAQNTSETDIILGGHTHTFLREPVKERNLIGNEVIINQVGFGGILLGRLDVYFNKKKKKNIKHKNNIVVH